MTLKSFQFLAVALAAAGLLAFPQPGAAQPYSDSFEGGTIDPWWTQTGGNPFALSTAQAHTGPQSLVGVTGADGGYQLAHTFSGPVRGEFSVWVWDDPANSTFSFEQRLAVLNAGRSDGVWVQLERVASGSAFIATVHSQQCDLQITQPPASGEWRRMRAAVGDTQVVVEVADAGGPLGTCTLPISGTMALTHVVLQVFGGNGFPLYFDDFNTNATPSQSGYTVSLLYDPAKPHKSGSTVPIKLQVLQGGVNVSSASLVLNAYALIKMSDNTSGLPEDSGSANPDSNFRFDPALGGAGGYIFNLSTKGLGSGTYRLKFTANGQGDYSADFQVK